MIFARVLQFLQSVKKQCLEVLLCCYFLYIISLVTCYIALQVLQKLLRCVVCIIHL